jgi:predicted nucleotidyltransferase component of viral defense system
MSLEIIQQRLESYACGSQIEEEQAIREITQEVVLAALGRTEFFNHAAFHGGTCLRIFYGINRFSEDLDFALREPDGQFSLAQYLAAITEELGVYGYDFEIRDRNRPGQAVQKAFLKDDSLGKVLRLGFRVRTGPMRKIRIKLEVDTNPPAGGGLEVKYLDFPFVSSMTLHDAPSLFAGKLHALLCRQYLKGRDWYDFIWYTSAKTKINFTLLSAAMDQTGPWCGQGLMIDTDWCKLQLKRKVSEIDWSAAAQDVRAFTKPQEQPSLDLWSEDLFTAQIDKIV